MSTDHSFASQHTSTTQVFNQCTSELHVFQINGSFFVSTRFSLYSDFSALASFHYYSNVAPLSRSLTSCIGQNLLKTNPDNHLHSGPVFACQHWPCILDLGNFKRIIPTHAIKEICATKPCGLHWRETFSAGSPSPPEHCEVTSHSPCAQQRQSLISPGIAPGL